MIKPGVYHYYLLFKYEFTRPCYYSIHGSHYYHILLFRDDGTVPGDQKGAAGLDSAMFAHIKRNWNFSRTNNTDQTTTTSQQDASKSMCSVVPFKMPPLPSSVPGGALYKSYLMSTTHTTPTSTSSSTARLPGLRKIVPYKVLIDIAALGLYLAVILMRDLNCSINNQNDPFG